MLIFLSTSFILKILFKIISQDFFYFFLGKSTFVPLTALHTGLMMYNTSSWGEDCFFLFSHFLPKQILLQDLITEGTPLLEVRWTEHWLLCSAHLLSGDLLLISVVGRPALDFSCQKTSSRFHYALEISGNAVWHFVALTVIGIFFAEKNTCHDNELYINIKNYNSNKYAIVLLMLMCIYNLDMVVLSFT